MLIAILFSLDNVVNKFQRCLKPVKIVNNLLSNDVLEAAPEQ